MQPREKVILGILLGFVGIWQAGGWVSSAILGPFQTRQETLERLTKTVSDKEDQLMALVRAGKSLKEARAMSLPLDAGTSERLDAVNAERLYTTWLTDLVQLCEMEELKVIGKRRVAMGKDYVAVFIKLEADARYEQIVRFLDFFYRTNLLHRVVLMQVASKELEGDPVMRVTLEVEGLALAKTPTRRTLFPQTILVEDLSEEQTTLKVEGMEGFPQEPGFQIRVENEFLIVTAMEGNNWTVRRGVDLTTPVTHFGDSQVELVVRQSGETDWSQDQFAEMVAKNPFIKPLPPYNMKLIPVADKPFVRGRPIELYLGATGYDTSKGKPQFSLLGNAPPNLKLDKFGKLTWRPGADVKADKYSFLIEARHPSAPQGVLTETISIRLRDANPAPKLASATPPVVYLNREWHFKPELNLGAGSTYRYTWKLGSKAAEGLTIDDATGELNWTPGDDVPPGELTVPLIVTDNDSPPQSTTLQLKLDVQDDAAYFTRLSTIFRFGDSKRALFYDASKNKKTELLEGDEFSVADLHGTVKQIARQYIVLKIGQRDVRLEMGQSLREANASVARR